MLCWKARAIVRARPSPTPSSSRRGFWDSPHWHSATARVFVAKGELGLAYGERLDPSKVERHPAGSFVVVPAGAHHFDGSAVDTIIIGVATGPWSTTYVDGSKPASAGTPIR